MPPEADVLDAPATTETTPPPAPAAPPAADATKEAPAAAPAADATKTDAVVTDPGKTPPATEVKPSTSSLDDDGDEPAADPAAKTDDKQPATADWGTVRSRTVDRYLARIESGLKKTVSAADLPKELAKAKARIESQLGRYASLDDALLAGFSAQEKIRSGKAKETLAEDATPEEISEWRAANNIPESPDKYEIAPVDGYKWSEADAPALMKLKETGHALNLGQKEVNGIAQLYAGLVQEAKEAREEAIADLDATTAQETRDVLRDELKGEYKPAITVAKRLLSDTDVFPNGLGDALAQARLPNGRRIINDPAILKFLIETARERYGEGSMITGQAAEAAASEEAEIEALMNKDIAAYRTQPWKNTGKTASERMLEIMREKETRGKRR